MVVFFSSASQADNRETLAPKTGSFTLTQSLVDMLGAERAHDYNGVINTDEAIEWEVFVPEQYDPDNPPGLLVFISPGNSGRIPRGWSKVARTRNLIWVAANHSGNKVQVARRIGFAILAAGVVDERYEIDASRIYLSGFSGGARVSGLVASYYPQLFRGAIFAGGAELWEPGQATTNITAMQSNRYVFLFGSEDFNRESSMLVRSQYKKAGIVQTQVKIMRRVGHEIPNARYMMTSIDFLDGLED